MRKLVIFALTLFLLAGCAQITSPVAARHKTISVIPVPVSAHFTNRGTFTITAETTIGYSANAKDKAEQLAGMLRPATGFALKVEPSSAKNNSIRLVMEEAAGRIPLEGYELSIDRDSIHVTASSRAGLFYGCQSLLQLLPVDIYKKTKAKDINWTVQAMEIRDYPRFGWRGAMLDVARHYMPKEFIFKLIDTLAMHKMNSLQLHLTDDQGWRIEIKKYPKLTETGAWRKETLLGHYRDKPHKYDGKKHGGFYTQDDIREIVEYAKQRHVNIVPEIEMPGHTQAAIASYPHLGNTKEKLPVRILWGVNPNIVNPNESTILFFQDILTEVMELFPSKFIHIGGDEAPKDQWKASADAQKRIKELGLKDEHELQSYFIKRMDKFLASKGRRLIGWDEILEGGLAPGATVMSWRGEAGGIKAAQMGHDVVMAPTTYTYFDYYQSRDKNQPLAIGGFLPLEKVYGYDPVTKALTEEQAKHVLGTQGQLWTEYISTPQKAEYMGFPRLTALAEVAWTPRGKKDYADFIDRLKVHNKRLDFLGVNYCKLSPYWTVSAPEPYGAVPTANQLAWHEMEYYGLIHYGLNTYTGQEWGYGDVSPDVFKPTDLNTDQWARAAKAAGMTGLIFVAKHHDGFCLWPSKTTEYTIAATSWKDGKGDVLGDLSKSCKKYGLKLGIYISPWDRNHAEYGREKYVKDYHQQWREVLTNYDPVFEVWFDGANGGTGYYGGARERRSIPENYYQFDKVFKLIKDLQPQAVFFNGSGIDAVRWVGNEAGVAGETNWSTVIKGGKFWFPAEADTTILYPKKWFYNNNSKPRTLKQFTDLYYTTIGRNASFSLGLSPGPDGRLPERDVKAMLAQKKQLDKEFAVDLAKNVSITASEFRESGPAYSPDKCVDGTTKTYWATSNGINEASLIIDFGKEATFNRLLLQEYIALGQRVDEFTFEVQQSGKWQEAAQGTTIGYKRILRLNPVTTSKARLTLKTDAPCLTLSNIGIYNAPIIMAERVWTGSGTIAKDLLE